MWQPHARANITEIARMEDKLLQGNRVQTDDLYLGWENSRKIIELEHNQ